MAAMQIRQERISRGLARISREALVRVLSRKIQAR
jgi:hypothetical protein